MTLHSRIAAMHRLLRTKVGLVPEIALYVIILCAGFIAAWGAPAQWLPWAE